MARFDCIDGVEQLTRYLGLGRWSSIDLRGCWQARGAPYGGGMATDPRIERWVSRLENDVGSIYELIGEISFDPAGTLPTVRRHGSAFRLGVPAAGLDRHDADRDRAALPEPS